MAKYKVSELEGVMLDAAVVLAAGGFSSRGDSAYGYERSRDGIVKRSLGDHGFYTKPFRPSVSWSDAGPIIELDQVTLIAPDKRLDQLRETGITEWVAAVYVVDDDENETEFEGRGPTPLIAAMRAYVASKLGEEIDL